MATVAFAAWRFLARRCSFGAACRAAMRSSTMARSVGISSLRRTRTTSCSDSWVAASVRVERSLPARGITPCLNSSSSTPLDAYNKLSAGTIRRAAQCDAAACELVATVAAPDAIVAADDGIYWTNNDVSGGVYRLAK